MRFGRPCCFSKPWEQAPHPQGIRSTQSTPVGKVSQQGLVESPCLSCPITVKMKQPTIVLRTTVEFGMGNYLGLYQITDDVSFYKCHNVYISSSLWFWWKWSWKFSVCFIVPPLPSEVQKLNYYLLVFYFKDCLFAFRNHYENKSRFYPCLNHHFQKDILCWLFAIFPNSLQRVWLIFKRLFPKSSTLPHAQCLSFPE